MQNTKYQMLIDYHLHNHFSADSESKTADIAKKAIELGMDGICITNHVEVFDPKTGAGDFSYNEAMKRFAKIKKEIGETQKKFPDLPIKFGIELEYVPGWMDEMKKFIDDTGFDFLIGSVHEVDNVIVSSSDLCGELYKKVDEEYAYGKYFDLLYKMVEWSHFSVVGHFDICKKGGIKYYGPFQPQKYKNKIIPILKLMKQKGIGIELNAKCMHEHCNELFPHPDILKWCVKTGIEHYTLGSDAHSAEDVGKNLDEAIAIAKEAGIKNISTYKNRRPTKYKI
jgi:histidinol-phosphatase (PHP family)